MSMAVCMHDDERGGTAASPEDATTMVPESDVYSRGVSRAALSSPSRGRTA